LAGGPVPRQVIMKISGDNVPSQRIDPSSFSGFVGYGAPRYRSSLELLVAPRASAPIVAARQCLAPVVQAGGRPSRARLLKAVDP